MCIRDRFHFELPDLNIFYNLYIAIMDFLWPFFYTYVPRSPIIFYRRSRHTINMSFMLFYNSTDFPSPHNELPPPDYEAGVVIFTS